MSGVFLQRLREFPQLVPFSRLRVVGVGVATTSTRRLRRRFGRRGHLVYHSRLMECGEVVKEFSSVFFFVF